jgi:2-polyprenyl-3-methyl-5-hydroxy-6-metoxy-1,4-benzoquinol methylase
MIGKQEHEESEYQGLRIRAAANLHRECFTVIEELNLPKGAMVLDLGAGEGAFSRRLMDREFNIKAVELEPSRFQLPISCYDIDLNSDFHDKLGERFDLIVAIEIIEHLQNPRHFISECLGLLKENGYLLVTSPNLESWISRIRFIREGRFLWFMEEDYNYSGHITPIFSWQIEQICREQKAHIARIAHTKNKLLIRRLGETFINIIKNKATYISFLYPFMMGRKEGEINIFLIKPNSTSIESG